MKIISLPVGQLGTNCYLVEDKGEVGIIDPGDAGDFIIRKITDLEAKPVWIAATHGHFDHILAVTELALAYEIPFYLNLRDKFLLGEAKRSAEYFTGVTADPMVVEPKNLRDGMELKVGDESLLAIATPGHTPGGMSLYYKKENALLRQQQTCLFSGDLIFTGGGVGRTDFSYCNEDDLLKSIDKILKLPGETKVYPGHEGELTLAQFKKYINQL